MLEELGRWRKRLGAVVFMYTPAHCGISCNEYADAAAKAGSKMTEVQGDARAIAKFVTSRPCLYVEVEAGQTSGQLIDR